MPLYWVTWAWVGSDITEEGRVREKCSQNPQYNPKNTVIISILKEKT